jgi:hypothetical protein
VPYEARQPSMFNIEMVPIHTKYLLWEMREREIIRLCLSAPMCRKAFFVLKGMIFSKQPKPIFNVKE